MNRPVRRYVEKFEALDLSAGTYHARQLPRSRYNSQEFLEYLSAYNLPEPDLLMEPEDWLPEE